MSIELERSRVKPIVKKALRKILWRANAGPLIDEKTAEIMIEVMWEVAATTVAKGPEKGILAGIRMLQSWED